jgi:hypothetical protein
MAVSRFRKFLLIAACFALVVPMIVVPYVVTSREEGGKMLGAFQKYTRDIFRKENVELQTVTVKPEFQVISYGKPFTLIRMVPSRSLAEKISTITSTDATLFGFMRMYTLFMTPKDGYNFPLFSLVVLNMGAKRFFALEIIDPARISEEHITQAYEKMKKLKEEVKDLPDTPPGNSRAKEMTMDFSIHTKADNSREQFFLDLYDDYLSTYLKMVKNAPPLTDPEQNKKVQEGVKAYVNAVLEKGGPAVNVFKFLLSPEQKREVVKTVLFGGGE